MLGEFAALAEAAKHMFSSPSRGIGVHIRTPSTATGCAVPEHSRQISFGHICVDAAWPGTASNLGASQTAGMVSVDWIQSSCRLTPAGKVAGLADGAVCFGAGYFGAAVVIQYVVLHKPVLKLQPCGRVLWILPLLPL